MLAAVRAVPSLRSRSPDWTVYGPIRYFSHDMLSQSGDRLVVKTRLHSPSGESSFQKRLKLKITRAPLKSSAFASRT